MRATDINLLDEPTQTFGTIGDTEFHENPEPRVPCVLLIDVSKSMRLGGAIDEVNAGIKTYQGQLFGDALARKRVDTAIVTFADEAELAYGFQGVEHFVPPTLTAAGSTAMGAGLEMALNLLEQRMAQYASNGVATYKPWIFLLTDGEPNDDWQSAAARAKAMDAEGTVAVLCVGVRDASLEVLSQCSNRDPVRLVGMRFNEMFLWLSRSLTSVSRSMPGERVAMPSINGWATV